MIFLIYFSYNIKIISYILKFKFNFFITKNFKKSIINYKHLFSKFINFERLIKKILLINYTKIVLII